MTKANYSLRLQPSLKAAAERLAAADGTSLNQFINVAVAEKLSALETEAFFRARAADGSRDAFLVFLNGAGDEEPAAGDSPAEPSP
ncbi:toxin-antitoxin system HicB family antitoxin [Nitrospirillum viridazoti]|uniref:HicB-like protein involved in pilus formation n=1 Tax=Nitrospirillum amazonense TaxID=28077 RepID=A0A560INC1_9PROT|nr:toxin-antitoxin system HicB family antitoxin [Nitrospirillum amazonense]TWB58654.1 HicB-like protein involved in pilus formation [Nitrospirillum amazonense]